MKNDLKRMTIDIFLLSCGAYVTSSTFMACRGDLEFEERTYELQLFLLMYTVEMRLVSLAMNARVV